MSRSTEADQGFALVDVLVALTLLGLVFSLIAMFAGQARTIRQMDQDAVAQMELDAVGSFVESMIAEAEPLELTRRRDNEIFYLHGNQSELTWIGTAIVEFNSSALREMTVGVKDSEEGRTLVLRRKPIRTEDETAVDETILLNDVHEFSVSYLAAGVENNWTAQWNAPGKLPAAIKIAISVIRADKTIICHRFARLKLG